MGAYDCIVLGVGAMGAATCLSLARRGLHVLGLEKFGPAHDRGSSHGQTRIIRKAYFEHPDYVPLLHRAYELWDALSDESRTRLFERVGLLMLGPPAGDVIAGVRRAAREHKLAIENLAADDAAARFPGFRMRAGMDALYEPDAGFLHVETCVRTLAQLATARGATLRFHEAATAWTATGQSVRVQTTHAEHTAARLVITAGAWAGRLLADLCLPLTVLRKVQLWFAAEERYRADRGCPVFCADTGDAFYYGAPIVSGAEMKIAEHSGREVVADADLVDRTLHAAEVERVADFARLTLPGVSPTPVRHAVCLYTMTPDGHFILDRHPQHESVCLAAGFSGHGFKFAPLIGSVLADLTIDGKTSEPTEFLSLKRASLQ
jgi:sarcosine oxidase